MTAELNATLRAAVRRYVTEYPDLDFRQMAEAIVAGLTHAETRYAAVEHVIVMCSVEDRVDTRQIEKKAAAPRGYEYNAQGDLEAVRVRLAREDRERAAERARAFRVADGAEQPRSAADLTACREWASAWRESERLREEAAQREQARHQAFVDRIKAEARMEWTADLLASTFAVGDGSRVSWAEATVAQHERRIAFLTYNVEGNLDTLKRHEAAVAEILAAHADTLAEATADLVDVRHADAA